MLVKGATGVSDLTIRHVACRSLLGLLNLYHFVKPNHCISYLETGCWLILCIDIRASNELMLYERTLRHSISPIWARFLSLARSKVSLCSANHRPGYWSNPPGYWLSTAWAYFKQERENRPRMFCSSSRNNRNPDREQFMSPKLKISDFIFFSFVRSNQVPFW